MRGPRIAVGVTGLLLCSAMGCGSSPMGYTLSEETRKSLMPPEVQGQLAEALDGAFGTPASPQAPKPLLDWLGTDPARLARGAAAYRRLCMHCHGLSGDGGGPTAPLLFPRPRDYRPGVFKFTSTAVGAKPTLDDLLQTIREGIPGTSMPAFEIQYQDNPEQITDLRDYVVLLSIRGQTERFIAGDYLEGDEVSPELVEENAAIIVRMWSEAGNQIVRPSSPPPPVTGASLLRGRELFRSSTVQCYSCHGPTGRGDGQSSQDPKKTTDYWGQYAPPANLTTGFFRGGRRPIDLFRRIHSGVKGTPMPSQAANLNEQDIWHLVNFVRSLPYIDPDAIGRQVATAR